MLGRKADFHPPALTAARVRDWSSHQAEQLYHVPAWGSGYFFVNELGHVAARPVRGERAAIDLFEVAEQLKTRGVQFPVLVRLQDLLKSRVIHLNESFRAAIEEERYGNKYQGVFPIKVNQLREVVEEILQAGEPYGFGMECGSKAELVAALPYLEEYDTMLLCNGGKDPLMMRLMLSGQRLGKNILPILERYGEFDMLLEVAGAMKLSPQFGLRVRLTSSGAGLWSESGGENSKFGISLTELTRLVEELEGQPQPASLRLLHFHLGSQIADLANVRNAVREAAQVYVWLHRRGIRVEYFDIGGGLGVNYEADNPDAVGYINYTLDDYTRAVVSSLREILDAEEVPHPVLVSESGRAVTAHHSVLFVEVIDARSKDVVDLPVETADEHPVLREMHFLLGHLQEQSEPPGAGVLQEMYGTAGRLRSEMTELFREGEISLEKKALFERLYWSACASIVARLRPLADDGVPADLDALDAQLVDHYLCDFSVFRSMVDYWAIGQRFPIMPLHRLGEAPTRRATLADLTCDSDGQVKNFVSPEGDKRFLELHPFRAGDPYYLGFFLMGAYQDIMGDMHNLFGRVTEAHIFLDEQEPGNFYIEEILLGASVEEQLGLVQYHRNDLERRMGDLIQQQVKAGAIRPREGVKLLEQYRRAFQEYTYLDMSGE